MNFLLSCAITGLLAWPIRGQFGGELGGLIVGIFIASAITLVLPKAYSWKSRAFAILFCALGFTLGGEMSYGKYFSEVFSESSSLDSIFKSLLQLIGIGSAWGLLGGLGLGFGLSVERKHHERSKIILSSSLYGALGVGIGFLISSFCLIIAGRTQGFFSELLCLRDQIIGICAGISFGLIVTKIQKATDAIPEQKDSQQFASALIALLYSISIFCCLQNVLDKWLEINWISATIYLTVKSFAYFVSGLIFLFVYSRKLKIRAFSLTALWWAIVVTALAISKEALPAWPHRWEMGFSILILTLIVYEASIWKILKNAR